MLTPFDGSNSIASHGREPDHLPRNSVDAHSTCQAASRRPLPRHERAAPAFVPVTGILASLERTQAVTPLRGFPSGRHIVSIGLLPQSDFREAVKATSGYCHHKR